MKKYLPLLSVLLILCCLSAAAIACPNCKEQLPNTDASSSASVPAGFNMSIYSMLGGLFVLMALGGRMLFKVVRETDRAK
jgi:hypothetical protein